MAENLQAVRDQAEHTLKAFGLIVRHYAENELVTSTGTAEFRRCYDAARKLRIFMGPEGLFYPELARSIAAAIARDVRNALGNTDAEGKRLVADAYQSASLLVVKAVAAREEERKVCRC